MASELVRKLLDAGIHFGHRTSRWNPKMTPYIFGKRNLIHIIDIRETVKGILRAKKFIARVVARGDDVLFVGTKRQARNSVLEVAGKHNMPYVTERWLGGTLTNFRTIRSRLTRLEELERIEAEGMSERYSKKMVATLTRELRKIRRNLDGIRKMNRLPGALVLIDLNREHIASREARALGIPVVALIDTDSDPDNVDIPIPGNDDAIRAIELVLKMLGDAIEEGKRGRIAEEEASRAASARRSSRAPARPEKEGEPAAVAADEQPVMPNGEPSSDSAVV